ncbi:MAG: rhomboid family intramembrane serine protease [Edaphobacter sp.]|uniref:rhomboid family intramembrane serine protease n=1 Tax=Edaphobacter sp. TaxID=1934404 RepID=UPI002385DA61|nr:rhomboid family intramembrane serine protease [Edaphobacter sp.]MDE1177848.1 rhomboid family intramembrane serine protease [Edaphobacter sp.]
MSSSFPQQEGEILPPTDPEMAYSAENVAPTRRRTRSILSARGTYILVGINCAVYLWMVLHGVDPASPTPLQLIHFGANIPVLVLHGEWYRLLTATFVHVGLIHLLTNMWCLWNLGLLGEPLLGPWGMGAVYLLTGIAGNLLSLGVNVVTHDMISVGAGASGAVFGIAGILIVLLSNHKLPIPVSELQRLRKSVIQFAALNLVIGLATIALPLIRIDNSAHVGGFLSGLALGVPLVPEMTSGRERYLGRQKIVFAGAALFLALFGYGVANMH